MQTKIIKKKKLSLKKVLILLLSLYILGCFVYYLVKLPIKNIYITGTSYISDTEIIEASGIKNYPSLLKVSSKTLKNKIETLDLVHSVKIKKNIMGRLTIEIEENRILFLNRETNKLVLEDKKEIENTGKYYGIPVLINRVLDDVYDDLITGLDKVNDDNIRMISEIQYSPIKYTDIVADDTRFLLRMNDGNHVIINTLNILKFNNYPSLFATFNKEYNGELGVLFLDSSAEDTGIFMTFKAIAEAEKVEQDKADNNEQ